MLYDVFICHASEDKDSFVRPLADALQEEHVEVWYDEFSLKLGDSIRRSLDRGLRQSRFGIVVFSKAFFEKKWPQYELDGLAEREIAGRSKVILPVWHGIAHEDVLAFSPSLANRRAVSSAEGLQSVVKAILDVVRPQGSPLIVARDVLLEWGLTPPVVTDEYWLNVIEASNRVPAYGAAVPEESAWGQWSFPLPPKEGGPQNWSQRLAWSAMQLRWSEAALQERISPLTEPNKVHDFIDSHAGLYETCEIFPDLLIEYAPQLTIRGMEGQFEALLERLYQESITKYRKMREEGSASGSSLTVSGECPLCDEEWALRHPTFGDYEAPYVAYEYFSGGMFGPPVSPYEEIDHAVWLLSCQSDWLPGKVHEFLLAGIADRPVWSWGRPPEYHDGDWVNDGAPLEAVSEATVEKPFRWTEQTRDDALRRFALAISILGLPETPEEILVRFKAYGFPDKYTSGRGPYRSRSRRNGNNAPQ